MGDIMAHVVVRVGDNLIESAITRRSADELKLKKGDTVTAVVKATEVMNPERLTASSKRNCTPNSPSLPLPPLPTSRQNLNA